MGNIVNFPQKTAFSQATIGMIKKAERRHPPQMDWSPRDRATIGKVHVMLIGHPSIPHELVPALSRCIFEILGEAK